jgi:hypothetical protein
VEYTSVDTGVGLTNLDPFVSARFAAQANGSDVTSWIVSPETAEAISNLKTATGSNQSLLQFVDDGIVVPMNPLMQSREVEFYLANTGAKAPSGLPTFAAAAVGDGRL